MASDMQADYRTRPITALEYHSMGEHGILGDDERVELLDGELIVMPPIGPNHAFSVQELDEAFRRFGDRAIIRVQSSFALDAFSEPEPDVMLLAPRADRYRHELPKPHEILLLVEVSNTSWRYDRGQKLRAYARAGIAEVWIVHLEQQRIVRFREPLGETYALEKAFARGEAIAPGAFPSEPVTVEALLP